MAWHRKAIEMSWSMKLLPLVLACACGGTTLASAPDDSGAGGTKQGTGGDESGGASAGGAAGGGALPGTGGAAGSGARPGSGGTAGGAGKGGSGGTREPAKHRPAEVVCGMRPSAMDASAPGGQSPPLQTCTMSSECTSGPNGRCIAGRIGTYCTYDECFNDSDCNPGAVCLCQSSMSQGSRCATVAGCRIDADCPKGFCSPTFGTCGNYSGVIGYACHSTADECVDDADCAKLAGGYCMHDAMVGRWICSNSQCAG
jgi:hypothetical protein